MNPKRVTYHILAAILIAVVFLVFPTALFAQSSPQNRDSGPRIVPRDEPYADMTYPEWAAKFWQWGTLLPVTHHPLADTSDCSAGQMGPVWFIDGVFCANPSSCNFQVINRTCTIPADKALFMAISTPEDSFIEESIGKTEADLRAYVKSIEDLVTNISVTIDGHQVKNPETYRLCNSGPTCTPLESPLFTYTLAPTDNVWAAVGEYLHGDPSQGLIPDGSTTEAVADGHFLLIEPLSPGWHTIKYHSELPAYGLKFDTKYHIQVVK